MTARTATPIRAINADQAGEIARTGRPAGLWYFEETPMRWRGIASDGRTAEQMSGSFADVLTGLMVRAGIIPRDGRCEIRNASRDPEWRVGVGTDPGIRIPGARVRDWREPVTVREVTPNFVVNSARVSELRAAGALPAEEVPDAPKSKGGRPKGSLSGESVGSRMLNDRIARLVFDGIGDEEIAARVGRSEWTVKERIRDMRRAGRFPNDQLPAWRVRQFQRREGRHASVTREEHDEIVRLRALGLTRRRIAETVGVSVKTVDKHISGKGGRSG